MSGPPICESTKPILSSIDLHLCFSQPGTFHRLPYPLSRLAMVPRFTLPGTDLPTGQAVYFCKHCRTILADSTTWTALVPELDSIVFKTQAGTLDHATALRISRPNEPGVPGSYHQLACRRCRRVVGRRYIVTTPQWSEMLQDQFALERDHILAYHLVSGPATATATATSTTTTAEDPAFQELAEDMTRVKRLICVLNERLMQVETLLQANGDYS
ncbi:hypothetical protein H4R33_002910 [Dimargaris cristalligena]|uniref:Mis18 domain-containing protein n=1 Tax=Dimargaris cristalligena TaxID=215637 RepID=A0A4P9ZUG7_9FUNG|nr:hypothetical protein H4R33_002910 [Dimargaris cristalligena]RKP37204.1 hypothetical protein BJ085DRAFT_31682 [Dimargaris cristalligena]|eukprot:RKP37204.1 hypothetical protein BJ085DRAFT_31682 [Dimargaris cristalligena]